MAQILPRDLPTVPGAVNPASAVIIDDGSGVWQTTPEGIAAAGAPINSQPEAEAGVINTGRMTPLRVSQAISALAVSQAVLSSPVGGDMVGLTDGSSMQDFVNLFANAQSYTVQPSGGNFTDLVAALDFLKTQPLNRPTTLTVTGSYTIPSTGYVFDHPNSRNLLITGPAFGGSKGIITNSAMTGTRADDLAYCVGRYDTVITIDGTDDVNASNAGGMAFPNGLSGFTRILFIEKSRYSLDFGFNRSHLNADGFGGTAFEDCAFFGSVWGIIGYNAHFSFNGTGNWFGYQISGGPMALFRSSMEFVAGVSNRLRFYQPAVALSTGPQYMIYLENSWISLNSDNVASPIIAKGAFKHGIFAKGCTTGDAKNISFDGITFPFSIGDCTIDITSFTIANADPANTSLVTAPNQPGVPGNEVADALISIGPGGCVRAAGGTITNCIAGRFIFGNGGSYKGYTNVTITGSKANVAAFQFSASRGNALQATIATPQVGSLDQSVCNQGGDCFWFASTGVSFSPALNTPTNGSGNYS